MATAHDYIDALAPLTGSRAQLVFEQARSVAHMLSADEKRTFDRAQSIEAKQRLLEEWFDALLVSPVKDLLIAAAEQGDWHIFSERVEAPAVFAATVTTAKPLSRERERHIGEEVRRLYTVSTVRFAIDPSLIGGAVIRLGDREVDYSARTLLAKFAA